MAEGSFGSVFHASYHETPVAVKECKVESAEAYSALIREFLIHVQVCHPFIVQLLGVSLSVNQSAVTSFSLLPSFVLEYMEHGGLDIVFDTHLSEREPWDTLQFTIDALLQVTISFHQTDRTHLSLVLPI